MKRNLTRSLASLLALSMAACLLNTSALAARRTETAETPAEAVIAVSTPEPKARPLADGADAVPTDSAELLDWLNAQLDAARSAEEKTFTLTQDLDFTGIAAESFASVNVAGVVFDLGGHTVYTKNCGVAYIGVGGVIQNGTFSCNGLGQSGSYALCLGDGPATDLLVKDVTTVGGIDAYACTVTLENVNASAVGQNAYYAVWCNAGGHVTINGGNYSAEYISSRGNALFNLSANGALLDILAGNFTVARGQNFAPGNRANVITVSGGSFNTNVSAFCAEGYKSQQSANGAYSVVIDGENGIFKAAVNGKGYPSVQAAIDDAVTGDTVTVYDLSNDTETVVIPNDKAVRIIAANGVDPNEVARVASCQTLAFDKTQQFYIFGGLEEAVKLESLLRDGQDLGSGYSCFYLYQDLTLEGDVTLPSRNASTTSIYAMADVTIDLNGHSITQTPSNAGWDGYPALYAYADTILTDSVGGGVVTGSSVGVDIMQDKTFTLAGGTITTLGKWYGANYGSIIRNRAGHFEMTGGELAVPTATDPSDTSSQLLGTIYMQAAPATATIEGGKVHSAALGDHNKTYTTDGLIAIKPSIDQDAVGISISGGWFTLEVDEGYLVDGFAAFTTDDGAYPYQVLAHHTVTVDGEAHTVAHGRALGELTAPADREGYTFTGWTDADGNAVTAETVVTGDMTVTSQWSTNAYTVTFTGETLEDATFTVLYGETLGEQMPDDPVRSSYRFLGWFVGEEEFTAETVITGDVTVTAQWRRLSSSVTVRPTEPVEPETPVEPDEPDEPELPVEELEDPDTPLAEAPVPSFLDVGAVDWFRESVLRVASLGIMTGVSDERFAPGLMLNRGMMAQILHNLEKNPQAALDAPFADISDEYYAEAVAWGADVGLLQGYSDDFYGGEDNVTREQIALMLYRYSAFHTLDLTADPASLKKFTDTDTISAWAYEAVEWAASRGLLVGRDDGTLDPGAFATRAEVAAILSRYAELLEL